MGMERTTGHVGNNVGIGSTLLAEDHRPRCATGGLQPVLRRPSRRAGTHGLKTTRGTTKSTKPLFHMPLVSNSGGLQRAFSA
jgi:hypothetical protein